MEGIEKFQRVMEDLQRRLGDELTLTVGFEEGDGYPDGTPVAHVAAMMEYGTKTAPARPFVRPMIAKNQDDWTISLQRHLERTGMDMRRALTRLGKEMEAQMRESMEAVHYPPLSKYTIKRKGHDKPLFDTYVLFRSIKSRVEGK